MCVVGFSQTTTELLNEAQFFLFLLKKMNLITSYNIQQNAVTRSHYKLKMKKS